MTIARTARRLVAPAALLLAIGLAPAGAAESYTLKDLSVDDGQVHLSAPELTVTGGGLSRAEVETLARTGKPGELLSRLVAGGAEAIAAPMLTVDVRRPDPGNAGGTRSRTSLKGLQVKGLKAGVAATLTAEGLTTTLDKGGEVKTGAIQAREAGFGALARLALGQPAGEGYVPLLGEARVEALAMSSPTATTSAAAMTLKSLRARGGKAATDLFPALGQIEISDLKGSRGEAPGAPRQSWSMASLTLGAEGGRTDAPGQFSAAVTRLAVEAGANGSKDLAELGYAPLLLAAALDGGWDAGRQELTVHRLAVSGEQFGGITFTALLGNVTRAALEGTGGGKGLSAATVKTMSVVVENTGLFERLVARQAKATGVAPAQARARMTTQAQMIAGMMLGEQARAPLGEAVNRFLAAPGRLTVRSEARTPAGVPVSELTRKTGSDPAIAGQFTVTAEVR